MLDIKRKKVLLKQILYHSIISTRLNSRPYNYLKSLNLPDSVFDIHKCREYLGTGLNHFWKRWRSKYITSFLEYQKLYKQQNQTLPSVGAVLNIYDDKVYKLQY